MNLGLPNNDKNEYQSKGENAEETTKNRKRSTKTFLTSSSRQATFIGSTQVHKDEFSLKFVGRDGETDGESDDEPDGSLFSMPSTDLDEELESLSDLPSTSVSQTVYIKACTMIAVVPSTYFFRHLPEQEMLMSNHGLGPKGTKAVAIALVSNTTISRLDLSYNGLGTSGLCYILDGLEANKTIKDLNLSGNGLGSEGAKSIAEKMSTNKSVTHLDVSDNGFTENDARYFCKLLKKNKSLRCLVLSQNSFQENGGVVLSQGLETNSTLQCLDLSWNHLRQRGATAICNSLYTNNTLKTLKLAWNGFGMEGCHEMGKALMRNRSLTELDLSANRVSFSAFRQLLRGIAKNRRLKTLRIGVNPITTDGAAAILRAICASDSGLTEIDLTDVSVDESFVNLLNEIKEQRSLCVKHGITLRHDDIKPGQKGWVIDTDDPVAILFEYMKQKNLRLIDLLHNLDKDNSDTLSRQELHNGLLSNDIPLSSRSLDILMKRLDINKDGTIDYEELVIKHKEYVRRATRIRLQADDGLSHFQSYDKLEQIREAIRLKIALQVNKTSPRDQPPK